MRKLMYQLSMILIMANAFAFASTETIDLSGTWKLESTLTDDAPAELVFVKTPFYTHLGGELYLVVGSIQDVKIWGASIESIDGVDHIAWWLNRGERFDGESNIILDSSTTRLSLGGDFETFEVATLAKIRDAGGPEGDVDGGEGPMPEIDPGTMP